MEDIIKLKSRYKEDNNYLKRLSKANGEESKSYVLKTDYPYRFGYADTKHKFVDPSGGSMIVEGALLEEANAIVKSIDFNKGAGVIITFE